MNQVFYASEEFILYFSFIDWEFHKQKTITDFEKISYADFIREIERVPDRSQAWKHLTIIGAGKIAGILEEIA